MLSLVHVLIPDLFQHAVPDESQDFTYVLPTSTCLLSGVRTVSSGVVQCCDYARRQAAATLACVTCSAVQNGFSSSSTSIVPEWIRRACWRHPCERGLFNDSSFNPCLLFAPWTTATTSHHSASQISQSFIYATSTTEVLMSLMSCTGPAVRCCCVTHCDRFGWWFDLLVTASHMIVIRLSLVALPVVRERSTKMEAITILCWFWSAKPTQDSQDSLPVPLAVFPWQKLELSCTVTICRLVFIEWCGTYAGLD